MAYMCLKHRFTESGRQRLLLTARLFDLVLVCDYVVFIASGLEMQYTFVAPLSLIKDFDAFLIVRLLLWMGFIGAFLHFFDIWVCWLNTYLGNRRSGVKVMGIFNVLKLASSTLLMATGVVLVVQTTRVDTGMEVGFLPALSNYSRYPSIKEHVDVMQQYFSCCGDRDYQDWFSIQWAPDTFLPPNAPRTGQNVPFSCCDPSAMRPCISDKINGIHPNYDKDKDKTIFLKGCRQNFIQSYKHFRGSKITTPWWIAIVAYVFHLVTVRYAETSIRSALEAGHPAFQGFGYLISCGLYADEVRKALPMKIRKKMAENLPLKHRLKMEENKEKSRQRLIELEKEKLLKGADKNNSGNTPSRSGTKSNRIQRKTRRSSKELATRKLPQR